jgi:chromosome segregation ATPase
MVDYVQEIEALLELLKKFEHGLNQKYDSRENHLQAKIDEAKGIEQRIRSMFAKAEEIEKKLDTVRQLTDKASEEREKASGILNEITQLSAEVKSQQGHAKDELKYLAAKIRKVLLQTSQTDLNELKQVGQKAKEMHAQNVEDFKEWVSLMKRQKGENETQLGKAMQSAKEQLSQMSRGALSALNRANESTQELHRKTINDLDMGRRRVQKLLLVLRRRMAWYLAAGVGGIVMGIVSLLLHFTMG